MMTTGVPGAAGFPAAWKICAVKPPAASSTYSLLADRIMFGLWCLVEMRLGGNAFCSKHVHLFS